MRILSVVGLMLIACSDPSLEVRFHIPNDYREDVKSASLSVILPPLGSPFDCEDIAFGNVSDETVRANTVEEVRLRDGSRADLGAIPREEDKLLLARGFDEAGDEVVAGCATYGLVGNGAQVQIDGAIVTFASMPSQEQENREAEVRITDVHGQVASGVDVRWTTTVPGANPQTDMAQTDENGIVLVEVAVPPLPGPISVSIHARWARNEPLKVSGLFIPTPTFSHRFGDEDGRGDPEDFYQLGRVGPNGEMGLAAMGPSNTIHVAYFDGGADFHVQESEPLPGSALGVALLTDGARDRVFTTSLVNLIEILSNGTFVSTSLGQVIPAVRRFFPLGNCSDPNNIEALLTLSTNNSLRVIRNGQIEETIFSDEMLVGVPRASGCLSSGGVLRRSIVYTDEQEVSLLVDDGADEPRQTTLGILPSGIAFSPKTTGEDALLIATTLGIEGTDIARLHAVPVNESELSIELVTKDATPTFARSIATGDFDNDGLTDIAAVLVFGDTGDNTNYRLYMSMGQKAGESRIIGLSGSREAMGRRPSIFVRDFNADDNDDIVIAATGGYEIFSMGPAL